MGTQQITAPPCAQPAVSGVIHSNVRHTAGFTVIGNHLAQHRGLSLVAVGLAVHIQSLPAGAKIGIKRLAERFPESETRIAAALRELEAAGYLHRSRVRLADGRIVTRTVSYNQPGADAPATTAAQPRSAPSTAVPAPVIAARPPLTAPPDPEPQPAAVVVPSPTARTASPAPLPQPQALTPELQSVAAALLSDLRRHAPQLLLSEEDIRTLVPGIVTWLERDAHADTIRHTLTTDLPVPLKHPAKLLRHRITTLLPPPLPGTHELEAARPRVIVIPLQNCDRCDRAFRSRHPGHCRDCRTDLPTAA
ncbi:helix-turn-helix domain-containing protein [Streptomyces atroolivaceus]|uniref:helix-turn-helix domain-containing protein n=1 Tax=Streptomyces atroolivaceus TaxID=66869 RepID=UPI002023DD18|nr:helix-turn-helix domain-containing protein [Streptomyces atroolivaceus]